MYCILMFTFTTQPNTETTEKCVFAEKHVCLILSPCVCRGFSSVFNMLVELKKVHLFNDLLSK